MEGPGGARRVDLYGVLSGRGEAPNLTLVAGDRIVVPPLGGTVAIAGEVGRPGIYELPHELPVLALRDALCPQSPKWRQQALERGLGLLRDVAQWTWVKYPLRNHWTGSKLPKS